MNVEVQKEDKSSLFYTYKKLISIRKERKSLRKGNLKIHLSKDKNVLFYKRKEGKEETYIFLNFSNQDAEVSYPRKWNLKNILFSTAPRPAYLKQDLDDGFLHLFPNEAIIFGN